MIVACMLGGFFAKIMRSNVIKVVTVKKCKTRFGAKIKSHWILLSCLSVAGAAMGGESVYSPGVRFHDNPKSLLWGDTHLHTNLSADAYMENNRTLSPEDAYRFARGDIVEASSGQKAALKVPLDFLVVADHSEFIGLFAGVAAADSEILDSSLGERWREYYEQGDIKKMFAEFQSMVMGKVEDESTPEVKNSIWRRVAETADRYNEPGSFSALIGYEWSSSPDANNLHRVVIYRDGAETATQMLPFSAVDSKDPEALWQFMERYEENTGGSILAIPHNGNLSNGLMFSPNNFRGEPIDSRYAETRARWEPVYEVTQIKGDGEAHPKLSPDDEFADYETWDTGNFNVSGMGKKKQDGMLQYEYARSALKLGLKLETDIGANPFQFGMIGSTDAHTSLPAVEEDNFFGKFVESEPVSGRLNSKMKWLGWPNAMISSSGLAAVWARDNTREEIFDAMRRREVYATTGSRIALRLFAGWDYAPEDAQRPDYVDYAYASGVPMGGELHKAPVDKAPALLVVAAKDPNGANLDRIQIVKGWQDEDGSLQEKVYDVAVSDQRTIDPSTGRAQALPSSVDTERATYRNDRGAVELATVWIDPDFDRHEKAFYYARVLEITKPRWTAYDAAHFNTSPEPGIEMTTQDRAYSSPIWYKP